MFNNRRYCAVEFVGVVDRLNPPDNVKFDKNSKPYLVRSTTKTTDDARKDANNSITTPAIKPNY
jgi:hypothetical protein